MAISTVVRVLLVGVIARCEQTVNQVYNGNEQLQYGDILRPPPPPPIPILPVPFHGGSGRQQQNYDLSYQYQVPPPPQNVPSPPISPPNDFKFPAPFYKQYNFNFVPNPQPFSTTPSPTIFQKVSQWLFPSQQTANSMGVSTNNILTKKDCNPCNLAPWIPVIRYDLAGKTKQKIISTYGPPEPTAFTSSYNTIQNLPQSFNSHTLDQSQSYNSKITYGVPIKKYIQNNNVHTVSSTYGPPSPTHTVPISQKPQSIYTSPESNGNSLEPSDFDIISTNLEGSSFSGSGRYPSSSYGVPSSSYISPSSIYVTPPTIATLKQSSPSTRLYKSEDLVSTYKPSLALQLPKVSEPTGFRNSYGEPILNTYALNIPYSVSDTAAETSKFKTEVLPHPNFLNSQNVSLALANPAPFSLNKGRNIHTLQPVALPNLSVSPLPPIFNARPFRPLPLIYPTNFIQGINLMDHKSKQVNITKSVPLAEFVHSIEYPTTIIQSPVIDLDIIKTQNHTKAFRHIPNSFIIDNINDISPQASEDHLSAAKSNQDASFETTGADYGNDLYENAMPSDLKYQYTVPSNHKPVFADLRGIKDEDVDKYRTEANLQHIDSPLLYLKPSAPHKDFQNFVTSPTPKNAQEYEMYDDGPTKLPTIHTTSVNNLKSSKGQIQLIEKAQNINRSKLVQIIVPYFTGKNEQNDYYDINGWLVDSEKEIQGRKAQSNTEQILKNITTEAYASTISTTEEPFTTVNYHNDSESMNIEPFDIIQLQHTIDDWTQQEYSKDYKTQERSRSSEKYAKNIPEDYLTTNNPITASPTENDFYDFYDHEGSSSIHYAVTDNKSNIQPKPFKHNAIDHNKVNHESDKNEDIRNDQRLRIYTAASKFRKSTTTPPPWGEIQTSISPLTQEKVYVVTSKPWQETMTYTHINDNDSKETKNPSNILLNDNLPFESPRFSSRPSIETEIFSKGWHQIINDLENHNMYNDQREPYHEDSERSKESESKSSVSKTSSPRKEKNS